VDRPEAVNTGERAGALSLRTFGGLSLFDRDTVLPICWESRKARLLFCYLTINCDTWVHRDRFIEMLWPGCSRSAGVNNFKTTLSRIRTSFTGHTAVNPVVTQGDAVRINFHDIDADMGRFRQHAVTGIKLMIRGDAAAAKGHLEAAQDCYTGEFLPEEPYNEFIGSARNELAGLHSSALRCLEKVYLQEGNQDALEAFPLLHRSTMPKPA